MRYLLDTHVILWLYDNYVLLPNRIIKIISDPANELYISSVTLWEIAIKKGLNRLQIPLSMDEIYNLINKGPIEILHIEKKHLNVYTDLEFIHRDPFDRLLISTAIAERLVLITHDNVIQKYDFDWLW